MANSICSSSGGRDPLLHLIGHPLPACIDSPCTSGNLLSGSTNGVAGAEGTDGTAGSTIDLFLLSLQKPILLFLFPGVGAGAVQGDTPSLSSSSSSNCKSNLPARACVSHLLSVQRCLASLRAAERKTTGGELEIFGMSTAPLRELEEWKERLGVEFHLLSDSSLRFTQALELPLLASSTSSALPSSPAQSPSAPRPLLQRLTLLLREGQVVGKDLLPNEDEAARAGERAMRLLEPHTYEEESAV
ncbi:hypothetical protein BCV69DRAFT_281043 [Microstroma glucosiphilum]|uniref:Alkyl hydroperoxide reductase subunit C/ Thiol specific antioxidant domain-containing protein n=1 Tax=Pseudomicrostroma glucosiphilum TaxID=1684307 RepID=A0A316UDT9_9BASI|nr:hypothetical protein BCV69DRAFT_281043 [Pseudomicrostroma glucosiphilum]PWN23427.1 hypothetical protein BCV69DRAFT_281043 [Pseudomicrostroma glucosiphilum]